jgi:hypothetical protein
LFGHGIKDIAIRGNRGKRWIPAGAHALYFKCAGDVRPDSVTTHLRAALDLASSQWLAPTLANASASRPGIEQRLNTVDKRLARIEAKLDLN